MRHYGKFLSVEFKFKDGYVINLDFKDKHYAKIKLKHSRKINVKELARITFNYTDNTSKETFF